MIESVLAAIIIILIYIIYNQFIQKNEKFASYGSDFSPYQNIELSDIDMLADQQFRYNVPLDPNNPMQKPDAQGDVMQQINGGNNIFQPIGQGVTPTNYSELPGEPEKYGWTIPQSNVINADEALARKQQHRGSMPKRAIDGYVRSTATLYKKYFANELAENESMEWWGTEASEVDTDFSSSE